MQTEGVISNSTNALEKDSTSPCGQTFIFQASDLVSLYITPYLIKKTKNKKGPNPIWQRVLVGTDSMRKHRLSPNLKLSPAVAASNVSTTSSFNPSSESKNFGVNLNKQRLLEWNRDFSGFQSKRKNR